MNPKNISIKIINLAHRTDRRVECMQELNSLGLSDADYQFFPAKLAPENGAIGCSYSHAMALSQWLYNEDSDFCLMLEDDFHVIDPENFWQKVSSVMDYSRVWDLYLLASNVSIPVESTPLENVFRVINAQTTSAYLVGRLYAAKLIGTFYQSAELMRQAKQIPTLNLSTTKHFFALDSLWKNLQIEGTYWASWPQIALQRPSFSDIEQSTVDYKA